MSVQPWAPQWGGTFPVVISFPILITRIGITFPLVISFPIADHQQPCREAALWKKELVGVTSPECPLLPFQGPFLSWRRQVEEPLLWRGEALSLTPKPHLPPSPATTGLRGREQHGQNSTGKR